MAGAGGLPSGVVTFLLTDIEGSTRLWQHHPDVMGAVIARHEELIRDAVSASGGFLMKEKGEGDSTFSVFSRARDAAAASIALQVALADEPWPPGVELTTRAALHTGEASLREGDYFGTAVNRCARIRATAHGGQIVCSQTTADLLADDLPPDVVLLDLGSHGLRDLSRPERIHALLHPALRTEFPPLRSLGSARSNLPAQRTSLIGRADEVADVRQHLAEHRLVTLTGVGGCGKTRLAIEVATQELASFDGIFFCDLSTIAEPDHVATELATAVALPTGGPLVPNLRGVREELLDHLADRLCLLIIDNCEHLLDATASLVDDLLDRCPRVRILATSREALEVDGERTYTVPSLSLPAGDDDVTCSSVALFCERAHAASPQFSLTDDMRPIVSEICHRLDGIPLAIELAAGQLPALTVPQIAERLSDRFRLLSGGRRRVQRQQTLAAMLDWSHDLLSDDERTMLRQLSVFPQPFTLEQAETLASDAAQPVAGVVRSLVGKSLLAIDGDRLRMLETVRLYAQQRLVEAGEAEATRRRHRDLVLHLVEALPDEYTFTTRAAAPLVPEGDHIREALRWCEEEGEWELLARIASRSAFSFSRDLREAASWLEKGGRARGLADGHELRLRAVQAWISMSQADLATLVSAANRAVALEPDASGVLHSAAHGLLAMSHAMVHYLTAADGFDEMARQHIDAARRAAASVEATSFSAAWIGLAYAGLHELDNTREVFLDALTLDRIPDAGTGATYTMLAVVEALRGDPEAAVRAMERSCEIFSTDPWATATGFDSFWIAPYAPTLDAVGRREEASAHVRALVDHLRITGAPVGFQAIILESLGAMAHGRGASQVAVQLLVRGVELPLTPLDHQFAARHLAEACAALGDDEAEAAKAKGRQLTFDDACQLAVATLCV